MSETSRVGLQLQYLMVQPVSYPWWGKGKLVKENIADRLTGCTDRTQE